MEGCAAAGVAARCRVFRKEGHCGEHDECELNLVDPVCFSYTSADLAWILRAGRLINATKVPTTS